ncbi:hypothetical protein IAT38_007842 [Cryptococcus sp. DSM 104549]
MAAHMPGWHTEELLEEWPESSPSPPPTLAELPVPPKPAPNLDSIRAKRGSLRMLGQAVARPLPPSRSASTASNGEPGRIVSGHVDGGRGHLPSPGTGLEVGVLSPPSSRSSSDAQDAAPVGTVAGTFVVKDGVEDDRGAHLARNGIGPKGGKDIFGALPLERMFDPPSPPTAPLPAAPTEQAAAPEPSTSPTMCTPTLAPKPATDNQPRRASHQYAPVNPSRLSKSVTPSSNDSFTTTLSTEPSVVASPAMQQRQLEDDSLIRDDTVLNDEFDDSDLPGDFVTAQQGPEGEGQTPYHQRPAQISLQSGEVETDLSPFVLPGGSNYPFTFESPRQPSWRSATHGSSGRNIFDPDNDIPAEGEGDGPSHSTLNARSRPPQLPSAAQPQPLAQLPQLAKAPVNPALRLFRSTYDTYTREHLSALVDSIAIEPSPSPPASLPSVRGLRDWSPAPDNSQSPSAPASSSHTESTPSSISLEDERSSKRLRLSPASPPPRRAGMRDWGAQGRAMMDRIRDRDVGNSTDAASTSRATGSEVHETIAEEGPTVDYANLPPTPPLESSFPAPSPSPAPAPAPAAAPVSLATDRATHRSNPSTTSSGYLRAAEDIMARIKSRKVSESASDSPANNDGRRVLSESDENRAWEEGAERYAQTKAKGKGKVGPSPRRMLRRLSASEEVKRAAEEDSSDEQQQEHSQHREQLPAHVIAANRLPRRHLEERRPTNQASAASSASSSGAPDHPQPPRFTADDINRYMSSSTHATSTTVSTSFVKHRGPRAGAPPTPSSAMRMIRPDDVQGVVPDRIGKMRYDHVSMRWVRELGAVDEAGESRLTGSEESVDVFAGMESLPADASRARSRSGSLLPMREETPAEEAPEEVREEVRDVGARMADMSLGSVSSSGSEDNADLAPPHAQVDQTFSAAQEDDESGSESDLDEPTERQPAYPTAPSPARHQSVPTQQPPQTSPRRPLHHVASAPSVMTPTPSAFAPRPIRSALRNAPTPAGGAKKRQGWSDEATPAPMWLGRGVTPGSSGKRSVSFSDGRNAGKIMGLEVKVREKETTTTAQWVGGVEVEANGEDFWKGDGSRAERSGVSVLQQSARTKRIQGMLEGLEDMSLGETPSKPSSRQYDSLERPPSRAESHASLAHSSDSESTVPIKSFRTSRANRSLAGARNPADATFLTECSFGVAHDKLVEILTDVKAFDPHWEELREIDLKGKGADSVARLKEFLPLLDKVNLNDNVISYLSGIPSTVRTLCVAGNRLSSLTSVNHLRNLQYLDISRNQLDSVAQLDCLVHLRELKADHNTITDLGKLMNMDCLIKLSVSDNKIERLDLGDAKWGKLESLNLADNRIEEVTELHKLSSVVSINLDGNRLDALAPIKPMPNIRVLRFSDNDVSHFDLALFPKVRTLWADNNRLTHLSRSRAISSGRLENLSLRNQRTATLRLTLQDLENVQRLYLSGNSLSEDFFPPTPLYALVYLEAAACKITRWPSAFAESMPSLKVLNLNYNYLTSLDGVKGLRGLRKLTLVGGRLGGGESEKEGRYVLVGLKGLVNLEELDLRMNPSTLSYYFPLLLSPTSPATPALDPSTPTKSNQSTLTTSAQPAAAPPKTWHTYDTRFRKNLPDEWYSKRLVYRGLVMQACPGIRRLDGISVEDGERRKAGELLRAAMGSGRG